MKFENDEKLFLFNADDALLRSLVPFNTIVTGFDEKMSYLLYYLDLYILGSQDHLCTLDTYTIFWKCFLIFFERTTQEVYHRGGNRNLKYNYRKEQNYRGKVSIDFLTTKYQNSENSWSSYCKPSLWDQIRAPGELLFYSRARRVMIKGFVLVAEP